MDLRDYQSELVAGALSHSDNTLIQADTGAGKTRILAAIAETCDHVLIVAHRNALVSQLSVEFARYGIIHDMLAAKATIKRAALLQRRQLGNVLLSVGATRILCSIDTLVSKAKRRDLQLDTDEKWLIIVDEAHHVIEKNKWGQLGAIFKNSRIVGATATPSRLDGIALKRGKGGVFDRLIQAESLKHNSVSILIERGFLSPFKCYGVESRIDDRALVRGQHDYTNASLLKETGKHVQAMAGDAVKHYRKLANNKQAVVFCVSIEIAKRTADEFRKAGFAAAAIHSKMSSTEVGRAFDLFEQKQIQVLCNVDMTGEGVDIPAIEALIMLRKTASLTLYRQWVGRSLRPCAGKEFSIIIDHADNIRTHGLPDDHVEWRLEAPPAEQKSNLVHCKKCNFVMKAWLDQCPECGEILRSGTGQSSKDIRYIDVRLVELHRTNKAKEIRDNALAADVGVDGVRYVKCTGSRSGEITTRVAVWFFDNIKHKVTLKEAEDFFFKNNNMKFWSTHFKLTDLGCQNTKKCLKVFYEAQYC